MQVVIHDGVEVEDALAPTALAASDGDSSEGPSENGFGSELLSDEDE